MKKNIIAVAISSALFSCMALGCTESSPVDETINGTIEFGHYKNHSIQWYILDKDTANHRTLLVSKDVLDEKPYNYISSLNVVWEDCTIRSWLNGYDASKNLQGMDYSADNFISVAFTSEEQARIATVQVINEQKNVYGSTGGANTMDKLFLLSVDDVETFLGSKKGVCAKLNCTTEWWLRTPGSDAHDAVFVRSDGEIFHRGTWVNSDTGVRPAMWLND